MAAKYEPCSICEEYIEGVACTKDQCPVAKMKAEIERLTVNMNAFGLGMKREKERADTARADGIKEFAERLKNDIDLYRYVEEYYVNAEICYEVRQDWFNDTIDSLVKELTEEQNGNL